MRLIGILKAFDDSRPFSSASWIFFGSLAPWSERLAICSSENETRRVTASELIRPESDSSIPRMVTFGGVVSITKLMVRISGEDPTIRCAIILRVFSPSPILSKIFVVWVNILLFVDRKLVGLPLMSDLRRVTGSPYSIVKTGRAIAI